MKIKTWIKIYESYLPPRCRKMRYRECEEYIYANLKEIALTDVKLAFEDNSFSGKGKIYFYKNKLWAKVKSGNFICNPDKQNINNPLEELKYFNENCSWFFPRLWRDGEYPDKSKMLSAVRKYMNNFLLIDGDIYERTSEPRYVVITFGLGNNHGGTGMFCDYSYNPNISKSQYYSALQGNEAVAYANKTASDRGDTNDIGKFNPFIIVHMPEIVKVALNKRRDNIERY